MNCKNNIKVSLGYPGFDTFSFYCGGFNIIKGSEGHNHMIVKFMWEHTDENGKLDYDTNYGAPEAVADFLFQLTINERNYKESGALNGIDLKFMHISSNGVMLFDIDKFNMDVTSL